VRVSRFDPERDLILVRGYVWGARAQRRRELNLVLDTGAAETIITPDILDELGYSARLGEERTVIRSAAAAKKAT